MTSGRRAARCRLADGPGHHGHAARPARVAVDGPGNLMIADGKNSRIR